MNEGKNEGFPREVSKIQFPRDNAFYEIHIFKHLKFTNEIVGFVWFWLPFVGAENFFSKAYLL